MFPTGFRISCFDYPTEMRPGSPYLSQHADPSSGCAQHGPPSSLLVVPGVQQIAWLFFGVQQEVVTGVFSAAVTFVF
jgi:hypothetical protein